MEQTYHIRGRAVTSDNLVFIRDLIDANWSKGRTVISRILCEHWNWRQPNGALKELACRALLRSLERKGTIELPPSRSPGIRIGGKKRLRTYCYDTTPFDGSTSWPGELSFSMVRRTAEEGFWGHLIESYHYLGNPNIVGAYLKYLVRLDGRPVACLGWGSAAWRVATRDHFIGWDNESRLANLHKVAGNVRFLIFPWVRGNCLASRILSANIRRLPHDWQAFYNQRLVLLETFVDTTRFAGTCYKAANWFYAGETQGRGKYGPSIPSEPIKAVFLYPLSRNFRELLHH